MAFNVRGVCRQKLSGSNPASDQSSRSLSQSQPDPASEGLPFPLPPLQAWMREWLAPVRSSQKARQQLQRSEEHTSELQSLMRISYAVFCLKKKQNTSNRPLIKK